jgi:hypothetical protein
MNEYKCIYCLDKLSNIINYVNHTNEHKVKYGEINISTEILQFLMEYKIEPYQWEDDSGNLYLSYNFINDFDILLMAINELDHELMALDILNLLNPENTSGQHHFDDEEKKREYLFNKNIIDDMNSDMYANIDKYSYDEWEDFCHFTNNSLLMLCIKKKWNKFCMRLLDFDVMYDINYQNITNAYEMAIKYKLYDVVEKIKNDKRLTLKIN